MKRTVSILCICLLTLSCLALAGCGGKTAEIPADNPYIGTWTAVKAELKGVETDMKAALDGDTFIVVLNQDGSASFQTEDETSTARWQPTDDGFQLSGDVDMSFKASDKQVTTNLLGVTVFFDKTA